MNELYDKIDKFLTNTDYSIKYHENIEQYFIFKNNKHYYINFDSNRFGLDNIESRLERMSNIRYSPSQTYSEYCNEILNILKPFFITEKRKNKIKKFFTNQ